jgi:serine/threonine-protein kinase
MLGAVVEPSPTIEVPSRRFGRYLVRSRLGEGGMAEVFLAEVVDESGEVRSVALKLMKPEASRVDFAGEADLMGMMNHPNLVRRLEVGEAFGRPYISMEFLMAGDLHTLRELLKRENEPFPQDKAIYLTLELLKGLSYFHRLTTRSGTPLGLVHGDINPANVFFTSDGQVKLGDFGVAKSQTVNLGPQEGVAAGKLSYLSPEQTRGEALTAGSDLFTMGLVLYELLAGRHPFLPEAGARDVAAAMEMMQHAKLSLPPTLNRSLGQILKRVLHPDRAARYRTAGELAGDLLHFSLDAGLLPSREEVGAWLGEVLGIVA